MTFPLYELFNIYNIYFLIKYFKHILRLNFPIEAEFNYDYVKM